jgi:hypothetical protein
MTHIKFHLQVVLLFGVSLLFLAAYNVVFFEPKSFNLESKSQKTLLHKSVFELIESLHHEMRRENVTSAGMQALVALVRDQNAQIERLKEEAAALERKINSVVVSASPSDVHCPFFGGKVLPNIQNAPIAVYRNPGVRDDWIAKFAKSVVPGSLVLDMSSGERPYRKLFDHCKYYSHEFEGNKGIEDSLRGPGANKANRKYDYVGKHLNEQDCICVPVSYYKHFWQETS